MPHDQDARTTSARGRFRNQERLTNQATTRDFSEIKDLSRYNQSLKYIRILGGVKSSDACRTYLRRGEVGGGGEEFFDAINAGSPFQIQIIFLFYAYDNSFWPKHCILINIHVIPDCRWKYGGGTETRKKRRVLFDGRGQLLGIFAPCSHTRKHPLRPCADREMFIPCCSCKNYCKDRDSKIKAVALRGGCCFKRW